MKFSMIRHKKPYVTNGIESLYVDTLISVPAYEELASDEPQSQQMVLLDGRSPGPMPAPMTPQGRRPQREEDMMSLPLDDGIKIVYTPEGHALLTRVVQGTHVTHESLYLPECEEQDYSIIYNGVTGIVLSASLGYTRIVSWLFQLQSLQSCIVNLPRL